jgi:hypothetical protein
MMKLNERNPKEYLERSLHPAFEIISEINDQNSWTIHEDVRNSVDLFYRGNFTIGQTTLFFNREIKIKSKRFQNHQNSVEES